MTTLPLITSVPLIPKATVSTSNYVFSDMKLNDRIGGYSSGYIGAFTGKYLYIKKSSDGVLEIYLGKSIRTGESVVSPFTTDSLESIEYYQLFDGHADSIVTPTPMIFYSEVSLAENILDINFGYSDSTLYAIAIPCTILSEASYEFSSLSYGTSDDVLYTNTVLVNGIDATDAWNTVYLNYSELATGPMEYMSPYSHTLFTHNKVIGGSGLCVSDSLPNIENFQYATIADPNASSVVYMSHCVGSQDDRLIIDEINSGDSIFSGNLYLDYGKPTYDGTSLKIIPQLSKTLSYASFNNYYDDQLESDFTISFMLKLANLPDTYCPLFCSKNIAGKVDFVIGVSAQSQRLRIWASNQTGSWSVFNAANTGKNIPINSWCQITIVRSGNSLFPFINGKLGIQLDFTGNLTGGSEPDNYGSLSTNCTAKFDEFFVSKDAKYLADFVQTTWTVDGNTVSWYNFNEGESNLPTNAVSNDITVDLHGTTHVSEESPYSGRSCLKSVYGPSKLILNQSQLNSLFIHDYTVEIFFYMESHSGSYSPLLINENDGGFADLILGFTTGNTLHIWASSPDNTAYNVFNGVSTGVSISTGWNYLRFTGSNGKHQVFLNGIAGTILVADQITGGSPVFDAYSSDSSIFLGEIRLSKCVRDDDLRVFYRRFLKNVIEKPIDFYNSVNTPYNLLTLVGSGEDADQTAIYV